MYFLPFRPAFDSAGITVPGSQHWFTLTGTNTPSAPFTDATLATPLENPVVANGVGYLPPIYLNPALTYRVRIYDAGAEVGVDAPLEEYDPYVPALANADIFSDLADASGSGLVGFGDSEVYAAGTVGAQIKSQRVISDLTKFVQGPAGPWPFSDLFYDRVEYGQDNFPISPNAGAANFITPFFRGMYLGANHVGGGQTGFFLLHVNGAPSVSSTNGNYTPLQTSGCALVNVGGTGLTMVTAKGGFFGGASLGCAYAGATNLLNVTAWEFNAQILAGASAAYFSLAQAVTGPDHAVSGTVYDIGWSLSAQVGALGLKVGWGISAANGQVPLKTTGALFKVLDAMTFADAFDISLATITGSAFKSPGFNVDGAGRANLTVRGNFANDGAAATGSVPVGEVYRNGSVLQIRVA
jgi:hypothetical protein